MVLGGSVVVVGGGGAGSWFRGTAVAPALQRWQRVAVGVVVHGGGGRVVQVNFFSFCLFYSASNRSGGTIGSTQKLMAKRSCRNGGDDDAAPVASASARTRMACIAVSGWDR